MPQPALPTGLHLRQSQDTGAITSFGRSLLELCCATSMLIMNGRVTGDRQADAGDCIIATDSQASMQAIHKHIHNPNHLNTHKTLMP